MMWHEVVRAWHDAQQDIEPRYRVDIEAVHRYRAFVNRG